MGTLMSTHNIFGFYGPSRIFHLYQADRSSKVGENLENPGKNHLTIRKQNLAFPHVTWVRLKPQRWEISLLLSDIH